MRFWLFLYSVFLSSFSYAQIDSSKVNTLDEVLLVGNQQMVNNSINKELFPVKTINAEEITQMGVSSLTSVLNQQLNLSVSQDASSGRATVGMFGLNGDYVKILVDNVPLVSDNGYGNNIDLNQINVDNIARIEISEGAMGVLYGDNAMAGVINIITKKSISDSWNIDASLQEETVGNEYNLEDEGRHIQNLRVAHNISENWYASVNFSRNDFKGFKNNHFGKEYFIIDGGTVKTNNRRGYEWNPKLQNTVNTLLKYQKKDFSFFYKFNYYTETLDIFNQSVESIIQDKEYKITARDAQYNTDRFQHEAQAFGTFNGGADYLVSASFQRQTRDKEDYIYNLRTQEKQQTLTNLTNQQSDLWYSKATVSNLLQRSSLFAVTAGYEVTYQEGYDASASGEHSDKISTQNLGNYDLFSVLDFRKNKFSLHPGVRFNTNSNYGNHLIWSATANYKLKPDLNFRLVTGSAYKTPTFTNLYYYFVDANHNVQGNPDLDPEDGISVLLSAEKKTSFANEFRLQNSLKVFHFNFQDKIDLASTGESTEMKYLNIENYKILGFSSENSFRFRNFQTNIGLNYTGVSQSLATETNDKADDYLFTLNATASLRYYWEKTKTNFFILWKYNGEFQQYIENTETQTYVKGTREAYSLLDASIQKSFFNNQFQVTAGARNLLDVVRVRNTAVTSTPDHDAPETSLLFGYGRSYFLKIAYNLNF
ncbi:TonB-dependent receptor plug domain-containing protein [Zunongwangia sp.]|uniref:TonB-dependent receptor plug domain-containing protein n=1 Tax=Zunongwangia sp. TaxID=1965325 RepID=UPI003AA8C2FB